MIVREISGGQLVDMLRDRDWYDLMDWIDDHGCQHEIKSFPVLDPESKIPTSTLEMKLVVSFPSDDIAVLFKLTWL